MSASVKNSSVVINFVDNVERQACTAIKKYAAEHPSGCQVFSVAVAIERLVRALILAPAVFIEKIVLIGKSVYEYHNTADQEQKKLHLEECSVHTVAAIKTLFIAVPLALISNAILAVTDSINMAKDPLQFATHQLEMMDADSWDRNPPENKIIGNSLNGLGAFVDRVLSAAGYKLPLP